MADEVRIQSGGPNGNGFQLDLAQKKLGLTGPNVALLLLILIIGVVAYLRTGTINKTMQEGQAQLVATEDRVHKRVSDLFGRLEKLIEDVAAQNVLLTQNNAKVTAGQHELRTHVDAALVRQDTLVHQQTGAIDAKIVTLEKYIQGEFREVTKGLELINWNIQHPDRTLPLRGTVPPEERPPERGR